MPEPASDDIEPSFVVVQPTSDNDPRGSLIMRFNHGADALAFAQNADASCTINHQGIVYSIAAFKAGLDAGEIV